MELKKVGICTMNTGFNYGTCLQAYALKRILYRLGYIPEVYRLSGSIVPDRDARREKIFIMRLRSFLHRKSIPADVPTPGQRSEVTLSLFHEFYVNTLRPETVRWGELKRRAGLPWYKAFICGSDQIWNAYASYIDPLFYLRFAPREKRIAYAPSFGSGDIPSWNRGLMKQWISGIPHLSVREESGQKLIRKMIGKDAEVLCDPVFLLTGEEWISSLSLTPHPGRYCLAYFLNDMSETARKRAEAFAARGYKIISLPYALEDPLLACEDAGPIEFLRLVLGAEEVLSDSYHALLFSILFHTPVTVYRKPGASNQDQPMRLLHILKKYGLEECLDRPAENSASIDFETADRTAEAEKAKALAYLKRSLEKAEADSAFIRNSDTV